MAKGTAKSSINGRINGQIESSGDVHTLQVRDTCHQILECVPQAPDLERIRTILRASQWQGMDSDLAATSTGGRSGKRKYSAAHGDDSGGAKRVKRWTREQLGSVIQASEQELGLGLRERNVIQVDGALPHDPDEVGHND